MSTTTLNTLNKFVFEQVIFERRVLFGCTVLVGLSTIVWIVSISTDYWSLINGAVKGKFLFILSKKFGNDYLYLLTIFIHFCVLNSYNSFVVNREARE